MFCTQVGRCDFEKRTISITHTLNDIGGKHELTPSKTKHSLHKISMNKTTEAILREQLKYVEDLKNALGDEYAHPEMVFPSAQGELS